MIKFTTKLVLTATAIAALGTASIGHAETAPVRTINIADRDLTQPGAVERVKAEVRRSASDVCGLHDYEGLGARKMKKDCYADAVAKADAQVETVFALQSGRKAEREAFASGKSSPRLIR